MKEALVIVYSDLKHDARVSRQIGFLSKDFKVTAAAFGDNGKTDHTFIDLKPGKLTRSAKIKMALWSVLRLYGHFWNTFHPLNEDTEQLSKKSWDLIIANDVDTLPAAFYIKGNSGAGVILDAHEYAPRQFENLLWWRLIFQPAVYWICNHFLPQVDLLFTVGRGVANEYEKNFGIDSVIVTNAPPFQGQKPSALKQGKIRLVHHGIANPSRRPDLMLEMMKKLDERFTLDLYLLTSSYASAGTIRYIQALKERFSIDKRIRIHDPLPQEKIVPTLNQYDIGIFLLPPINFNYANALPNKFFDFIQAGLAVAIGPSPEMASYLNTYRNGVVSEDFEAVELASLLNKLTESDIEILKANSAKAAGELCAEKNEVIFRQAINSIS
ncbi:MAG: hypothetical protein ACO3FI_02995 [Cyclobacteriaceae bacterium]